VRGRRSVVAALGVALLVIALTIGALYVMGSQVSARLGGPCPSGQHGVAPGDCHS
jgi:hypothetical protein